MILLGVNIDHVATVREARKTFEPDPVWAASLCLLGGADSITIHLREDRRHIQDRDLTILRETVPVKLNLEMANIQSIVDIALEAAPAQATIVPERREEITTEGGLDVVPHQPSLSETVATLKDRGITVSFFIDPDEPQIEASVRCGADAIELHTGSYANAAEGEAEEELDKLIRGAESAHGMGLEVNAGHGINYYNIRDIVRIPHLNELNIGHSIISRSIFVGLEAAVREMKDLINLYADIQT